MLEASTTASDRLWKQYPSDGRRCQIFSGLDRKEDRAPSRLKDGSSGVARVRALQLLVARVADEEMNNLVRNGDGHLGSEYIVAVTSGLRFGANHVVQDLYFSVLVQCFDIGNCEWVYRSVNSSFYLERRQGSFGNRGILESVALRCS